jgi:hypothetical protein
LSFFLVDLGIFQKKITGYSVFWRVLFFFKYSNSNIMESLLTAIGFEDVPEFKEDDPDDEEESDTQAIESGRTDDDDDLTQSLEKSLGESDSELPRAPPTYEAYIHGLNLAVEVRSHLENVLSLRDEEENVEMAEAFLRRSYPGIFPQQRPTEVIFFDKKGLKLYPIKPRDIYKQPVYGKGMAVFSARKLKKGGWIPYEGELLTPSRKKKWRIHPMFSHCLLPLAKRTETSSHTSTDATTNLTHTQPAFVTTT